MRKCEVCGYDLEQNGPAKHCQRVCSKKNGNPKTKGSHKIQTECYIKRNKANRKTPTEKLLMVDESMGEKLRVCLRCDRKFRSLSIGNRICPLCKTRLPGEYTNELSSLHKKGEL